MINEGLREKAQELTEARAAKKIAEANAAKLDGLYKEEQTLRKKTLIWWKIWKGKLGYMLGEDLEHKIIMIFIWKLLLINFTS